MQATASFGRWLKLRRLTLDLTQHDLGQLVGCSPETIRKIEADERRPSVQIAERLAVHLAIPAAEHQAFVKAARAALCPDQLAPPTQTADQARWQLPRQRPHNLPRQATPLIGREAEVAAICGLLQHDEVQLLTLTGPGGVGKTRLALQVAAEALDDFASGVAFVALAPISDPSLVIATIAHTLGVREASGQSLQQTLQAALRERQLLLLLDNFEHLVAAAPLVADLLADCPQLKVLVSSRVPLHLRGEKEIPVPPLALPDLQQLPALDQLTQYAAVELFMARTRDVQPSFVVTDENARTVAEICARLDGLPLAIELAAARSKLFPPQALLTRLDHRLKLLTSGARDLPARQQTMRSTIEWSYNLLPAGEQMLFRRLAVFVGGCTLEAATEVLSFELKVMNEEPRQLRTQNPGLSRAEGSELKTLEGLAALIDNSLLRQEASLNGEPRFLMYETIREYALERLEAGGEIATLWRQHATYYLTLAERAEPKLMSAEQAVWLQHLETEHDNLRAALQWSLERGGAEPALRLGSALWRFWRLRGYLSEGRRWLEAALAGCPPGSSADSRLPWADARAKALTGAGMLAHYQGAYTRAAALCGQSLTLFRQLSDRRGVAVALHGLALVARSAGNYAAAGAMYQESLAISRELGDIWGSASSLCYLGVVYIFGADYAAARPVLEESLALFKQSGDREGLAVAIHCLGVVSWGEGDNRTAWLLLTEALTIFRALGNRRYIAHSLSMLGRVATSGGDAATAQTLYEESLSLLIDLGDMFEVASALEGLADAAVRLEQPAWAARLLGAASTLREALGVPRAPLDAPGYERGTTAARAQLGEQAFTSAWAAGGTMTPAQAIVARDLVAMLGQSNKTQRLPIPAPAELDDLAGLTAREAEVLRLVAMGLTDAQVAEQLIVSLRTVHAHLRSIYGKLQVTSRTAATRYALDHQLL
jgi:predicted ATPase/DNA-binding CsgD family transcriptional regulator/transcriptional regulator with XRE-family HTH domain